MALLLAPDNPSLKTRINEVEECSAQQRDVYRRFVPSRVETVNKAKGIAYNPKIVKYISGCRIRQTLRQDYHPADIAVPLGYGVRDFNLEHHVGSPIGGAI